MVEVARRFSNFELDVFQIMPNHMHGIIALNDNAGATREGAGFTPALNANDPNNIGQPPDADNIGQPQVLPRQVNRVPTVGDIVGAYKSLVTNACIDICNSKNIRLGKLWQRNYYERIIRNKQAYQYISAYIINNPTKWKGDKFSMERNSPRHK